MTSTSTSEISQFTVPTEATVFGCSLLDQPQALELAKLAVDELRENYPDSTPSNVKAVYMSSWKSHLLTDKFGPLIQVVSDKIKEASKLRKSIKKASKSSDNQAEVSKMAKDFAGIDPSRVEDIDQYIENATQVLNSAARKTGDPLMRNPVNMANMANYIEQEMEIQNEQIKNEILSKDRKSVV